MADHGGHGLGDGAVEAHPHGSEGGRAQPGGLEGLARGELTAEDVGGELADLHRLGRPARDADALDPEPAGLLDLLQALPQAEGQALQDGPVHVAPGVDVPEADHGALGAGAPGWAPSGEG